MASWTANTEETRVQITDALLLFSLRMVAIICLDAIGSHAALLGAKLPLPNHHFD